MKRQMIVAGLKARPVRTGVSILAVALEVMLILVVVGLTTGMTQETASRAAGVGAEIMVMPPGATTFVALSPNSMSVLIAGQLAKLPNVKAVAPVLIQLNTQNGLEVVYGLDMQTFNEVSGGFRGMQGELFKGPADIVVDDLWAQSKSPAAKPGTQVELLNHKFTVTGIVDHGQGARVFMSMEGMEQLTGVSGKAGLFYVKLKDPGQVKATVEEIKTLLPGYTVYDINDYVSLMTSTNLPGLHEFIDSVVFIALCIGVLVIFLSMYTTITERTREIGILRSLGASKAFIVGLIFQESLFVCIIGVIAGIGGSYLVARLVHEVFPTQQVLITVSWIVWASTFAILSGIIGSFYPSFKAAAQDPVEALAYE